MMRDVQGEAERIAALRDYRILDTSPEADFDQVVRLAARLLDVPIALISLVDQDRQWFKAATGLEGLRETPRDIAFCDHAIRGQGIMVVPDATDDPRFAENPLVTGEPGIRFYAGAPLITRDGHALGTLCVIDKRPHEALPDRDALILTELAGFVLDKLELRRETLRSKALAEQAALLTRLMEAAADAPDFASAIHAAAQAIADAIGAQFCHVWRLAADGERTLFVSGAGLGALGGEAFFDRLRAMVLTPANSQVAAALVQDVQIWSPMSPGPETASRPAASMASAFGVTLQLATPFGLGEERYVFSVGFAQAPDDQAAIAELLREATTALRPMLRRHRDEADSRIFRRMVETNPNGVLLTEPPFQEPGPRITYANPAFERMTGYSLAEIRGRSPRFLWGPDTDPQSRLRIGEEIAAGRGLTEEMLYYRKDGTPFWTSVRIAPVTDSSGSVTHYFSVQADITLARQAKLEREALTRDLKALISAVPGVLMRHRLRDDGKWTRSFIAPGVEALTGFTVEEAYAFGWWVENINESDKPPLYLKLRQAVEGGETQADFRFHRKDGAWIWIRILLRGHVGPDGAREVIGIWSDVSEEYRLRLDGERLTADLQRVIATMPGVLIRIRKNTDGRWVRPFISPAIEALTGYTVEEAHEIDWWRDGLDPRDRDRMMAMLYQGDLSKPSATDFRFRHKQGHTIWIRRNTAGFLGLDGQPEAISIWNDITAEKRLLLDQEAMTNDLQAVIQAMPGVLMRSRLREDQTWLRYFIAPGIEAMTGYTPAEAQELGWVRRLTHPDDLAAMNASLEAASTEAFSVLDFRFRHKNGHYIWVNRRTRNYWNAAGELELVAIWTDMSVERQLLAERGALALDLEKVVEAVPGALIRTRTDEHGRWHRTYVAPGIKLVTGHTPEEVLEPAWFRANLHPADHGLLNRNMLQWACPA